MKYKNKTGIMKEYKKSQKYEQLKPSHMNSSSMEWALDSHIAHSIFLTSPGKIFHIHFLTLALSHI